MPHIQHDSTMALPDSGAALNRSPVMIPPTSRHLAAARLATSSRIEASADWPAQQPFREFWHFGDWRSTGCQDLSGPHKPGDRVGCLPDLRGRDVAALGGGLRDAVAKMVFHQAKRHRLQRPGGRRHLGQDVDAVLLILDHPLQPADLALDPAQPLKVVLLVGGVSVHAVLRPATAPCLHLVTLPNPRTVLGVPTTITNVIATLQGTASPERFYVVTGHLDSRVTDVLDFTSGICR